MKIKNNLVEIIISLGIFILLIHSTDPIIKTDSQRYIDGNVIDPPFLYNIIIIMSKLFGTLESVIVLQTLLIGFSIIYFSRTMSSIFNLDNLVKILISIFLFLPIIKFYNYLLTETFGYAFSLLFVSFIIKLIYKFNIQNIFWSSFFIILLLLLRKQFLFLYPLIIFLYFGIIIINKSKKTFAILTISFISILVFHISLTSLDKYVKNYSLDHKTSLSNKYGPFYFIYIDAIYVSTLEDAKLFKNQNEQETLIKIFKEMNNQKALLEYYNGRGHYGLSFNHIRNHSDVLIEKLSNQQNRSIINLQKEISIKLIKANFDKYIKHIFKKFYDSTWLFIFLPFFMLLAALINFPKYKSKILLVFIFISLFSLANHLVTYIFGRVQPRYFIYTDFILLLFIFLIFANYLKKKKN